MHKTGNTIYIIVAALLLTVAAPLCPYAQTATGDSVYQYDDSLLIAPPVADSATNDYDSLNEAYEPEQAAPLVIAAGALVLAAEFVQRGLFFAACSPSRMPGVTPV